jgi:purine catabolism regulator
MMNVFAELVQKPEFGIRMLVAGASHHYEIPCQGVHVTDQSDPSQWLRGNEIVLTTGFALNSAQTQRAFVNGLVASDCLALGYSGFEVETPQPIIDACREAQLPLFVPTFELPLADITTFVTRRLLEIHFQSLRYAIQLYRQLLNAVINGESLQVIIDMMTSELTARDLFVMDREGGILARSEPAHHLSQGFIDTARDRRMQAASSPGVSLFFEEAGTSGVMLSVQLDGEVHAFIVAAGLLTIPEHEQLLLEQLHAGVAFTIARDFSERRTRRQALTRLLEAVDVGQMSPALVLERMRAAGISRDNPLTLFRIECMRTPRSEHLLLLLENELIGQAAAVTICNAAYFCVGEAPSRLGPDLLSSLNTRGWAPTILSSLMHRGSEGLMRAFREVNTLAQQQREKSGFFAVEDMDTLTILRSNDDGMLEHLVSRTLGKLIDHDAQMGTELLTTLECYLKHGCRSGPVAAELYIHRHTVTYRLKQIANLSGMDPRSGDNLLELSVALRLYRAGPVL